MQGEKGKNPKATKLNSVKLRKQERRQNLSFRLLSLEKGAGTGAGTPLTITGHKLNGNDDGGRVYVAGGGWISGERRWKTDEQLLSWHQKKLTRITAALKRQGDDGR